MEIVDIVNNNDEVIGQSPLDEVYAKGLPHRIVHILIFDKNGNMLLQKRSPHKSFCPNCWSTAVGGHVQTKETYEQAALREFEEELGITTKLNFLYKEYYQTEKVSKFLSIFSTIYEGNFNINPEEVTEIKYFPINTIKKMIEDNEPFHHELLFILNKYYENI